MSLCDQACPLTRGWRDPHMMVMSETDTSTQIIRDAGTLIVVRRRSDGPPLLLMTERAATLRFAGGAMVFPGGAVDEADRDLARSLGRSSDPAVAEDLAVRIAAIRETIEECGLALVAHADGLSRDLGEAARRALLEGAGLAAVIAAFGLNFDFAGLVPFARWCPHSEKVPRRFDTRFYIAVIGEDVGDLRPDGRETTDLGWYSAREMLDRAERGEARIIFPTRCNLERLARFETVEALLDHARAQPVRLISPWIEMRDGEEHLCIPQDHGYPVTSRPLSQMPRG